MVFIMKKYLLPVMLISIVALQPEFVVSDCSALPSFNSLKAKVRGVGKSSAQKQQITAGGDIATAQKNIKKLNAEKTKLENELRIINAEINQQQGILTSAQSNLNSANALVEQENILKENNRINQINQKTSKENQKLELKKLQLEYKSKLEIESPGISNTFNRQKKLKEFTKSANDLLSSGTDFETIITTLKTQYGLKS